MLTRKDCKLNFYHLRIFLCVWVFLKIQIVTLKWIFGSACFYTDQIPFPVWRSLPESHCCFVLSQLDPGQLYCHSKQQVIVSKNRRTRCFSHPKAASHMCQILLQWDPGAGLLGYECQKEGPTQVYKRASQMYQVQRCLPDPSLSSGQGFPKPKDSWLCLTSFKI